MGQNNYPETLTEAQNILVNYRQNTVGRNGNNNPRRSVGDGVMFAQNGNSENKSNGQRRGRHNIKCYRCGKMGHYSYENMCNPVDVAAYEQQRGNNEQDSNSTAGPNNQSHARKTGDFPEQPTEGINCVHFTETPGVLDHDTIDMYDEEPYYGLMCCRRGVAVSGNTASICYDNILSQSKGKINKDWLLWIRRPRAWLPTLDA